MVTRCHSLIDHDSFGGHGHLMAIINFKATNTTTAPTACLVWHTEGGWECHLLVEASKVADCENVVHVT